MSTSLQAVPTNPKDLARAPGVFGQSVAWLAVIWGGLCLLAGVLSFDDLPEMASLVAFGLAFLIPSLWWLRCASKDKKAVKQYEDTVRTNAYLSQFLTEADQVVIQGMGTPRPPEKTPRHWPGVSALSAVLFIASVILMPVEEESATTEPVATTTTSSSATATRSSAALSTTRNAEAEASRASAVAASRSAEAAAREAAEREASERAAAEEAARLQREAEEAERARIAEQQRLEQEQQVHQFVAPARAPEPAPAAAYYKNCTAVWNAIGSPIYAGQPGYDSHLDRDGDGIGCERDPR